MKVVAAMSGGVDSAVAAARLLAAGHEVTGVHLKLKGIHAGQSHGCGSDSDAEDARAVAAHLGIDLEVWDLTAEFQQRVIGPFLADYAAGRTPNPCLRCNATIKFAGLLETALSRGFEAVGTGHYASVDPSIPALSRARYLAKDQSYVLAVLRADQLRRCLFPLGDVVTKADVRAEAAALGLPMVAAKPDSTDICFIPDGDTARFLRHHLGEAPGEIVDVEGKVVGTHTGTHQFTIGQRRGLRLASPAGDGHRRYVLAIEPAQRRVIVGPAQAGEVCVIEGEAPNVLVDPAAWPGEVAVQVRAHGAALLAQVSVTPQTLVAELAAPCAGVAPGQGIVVYSGNRVLASATISAAH